MNEFYSKLLKFKSDEKIATAHIALLVAIRIAGLGGVTTISFLTGMIRSVIFVIVISNYIRLKKSIRHTL